jgi:hypothetical protein
MIGNPLAPILCALAITPPETQWFDLQQTMFPCVPIRYVDNLLAISTNHEFSGFPRDYYHFPIELENCEPSNRCLGFNFKTVGFESTSTMTSTWNNGHTFPAREPGRSNEDYQACLPGVI